MEKQASPLINVAMGRRGDLIVSARSTPDRVVQVQALADDIVLCSLLSQYLAAPRCIN